MSDHDFTVKEMLVELKSDIRDFIKESRERDKEQDTAIKKLGDDMIKVKNDAKWVSGIIAAVMSTASWVANRFFH